MDDNKTTLGQHLAENVAATVGSWRFITIQTIILFTWVVLNTLHIIHYDPYPYILLNLILSLQAAYTAPMILMAQNRQNEADRKDLYEDYNIDHNSNARLTAIEKKLDNIVHHIAHQNHNNNVE